MASGTPPVSKVAVWIGWILGVLPIGVLLFSGVMKLMGGPELQKGFEMLGWPISLARTLAILEIGCSLIYLMPRTAVLGAVLLSGYLGGAIATHLRLEDTKDMLIPIACGVFLWLGLFLRDVRVRRLLPIRT